jgi:antirestriction protein
MSITEARRVYAADLAAYNAGKLHGVWLDLTDPDTMHEQVTRMLAASPEDGAEEWQVHDYDGDWHGLSLGETSDLEAICEADRLLGDHGEAWAVYVDTVGEQYATEDGFQDAYAGEYDSAEAYAEELAAECGYLEGDDRNPLLRYVDWERFAHDLECDGYTFAERNGRVYVFRDC